MSRLEDVSVYILAYFRFKLFRCTLLLHRRVQLPRIQLQSQPEIVSLELVWWMRPLVSLRLAVALRKQLPLVVSNPCRR